MKPNPGKDESHYCPIGRTRLGYLFPPSRGWIRGTTNVQGTSLYTHLLIEISHYASVSNPRKF